MEKHMSLSKQLKILAKGINPDTGEILAAESIANSPDGIRFLFSLAEELADYENTTKRKNKLTPEERIENNLKEGKPAKSHFPWNDEEKKSLANSYRNNNDIKALAIEFERSQLAIAIQLEKLGLISEEESEAFRTTKSQNTEKKY